MRLDEVFKPLFEDVYQSVDISSKYEDIIKEYKRKGVFIYRGMKNTGTLILGNGNAINRVSANTHSFTNTLVDELLPNWDKFPDRLKSFICTTEPLYAADFGALYYVIPLDNQDIGVCPKSDFWSSFGEPDVETVNWSLYEMFKIAEEQGLINEKIPRGKVHYPAEKLKAFIDIVDGMDIDSFDDDDPHLAPVSLEMLDGMTVNNGLWNFLRKHLSPGNFSLVKYPNIPDKKVELWLSGRVLFVESDYLDKLEV